jgi:hypothetical protein
MTGLKVNLRNQIARGGTAVMSKPKIEDLSTEVLIKRKKFAKIILGVMIGVLIIGIGTAIWTGKSSTLFPMAGLIAVSIPMIAGLKKINLELDRRNNSTPSDSPV